MRTWKHTQEQWWIDDDGFIAAGHDDSYVMYHITEITVED